MSKKEMSKKKFGFLRRELTWEELRIVSGGKGNGDGDGGASMEGGGGGGGGGE